MAVTSGGGNYEKMAPKREAPVTCRQLTTGECVFEARQSIILSLLEARYGSTSAHPRTRIARGSARFVPPRVFNIHCGRRLLMKYMYLTQSCFSK